MNRLFHTNKIKTVQKTLVADQEDTNFLSSNLQNDNYTKPWRTTEILTAHDVVNDFGVATLIDTVWLGNVNLTSSATVLIQANATDSWGAPTLSETVVTTSLGGAIRNKNLYRELTTPTTLRFWRIQITDTGNPDGFYEVGEWFLGERVSLGTAQDLQTDLQIDIQRNNIIQQTEWLQKYAHERAERRRFTAEWIANTQAALDVFRTLESTIKGTSRPFVFVIDSSTTPVESFFVRMIGEFTYTQRATNIWVIRLVLEEEGTGKTVPVVT